MLSSQLAGLLPQLRPAVSSRDHRGSSERRSTTFRQAIPMIGSNALRGVAPFAGSGRSPRARRLGGVRRFAVVGLTSLAAMVGVQSTISPAYAQQPTWYGCAPGWLCLYAGANYNNFGQPNASFYRCGTPDLKNWVSRHGSYINNQTGNVLSTFWSGYGGSGYPLRYSFSYAGPDWADPDFDFYPVNSITVC